MKKMSFFRSLFYIVSGILMIIFYRQLLPYTAYVVGAVMFLYGADILAHILLRKEKLSRQTKLFESLNLFLFSGIMAVLGSKDFATACIIWAVWSIAREGVEIAEKVYDCASKAVGIFNFLESVVMIGLAIFLIAEPTEEHALLHIILLGVELILEIVFPFLDRVCGKETNPDIIK